MRRQRDHATSPLTTLLDSPPPHHYTVDYEHETVSGLFFDANARPSPTRQALVVFVFLMRA